jgi:hypothetical protein
MRTLRLVPERGGHRTDPFREQKDSDGRNFTIQQQLSGLIQDVT